MNNNTEYVEQFSDLEGQYYKEMASGKCTCPLCGEETKHERMTASVTYGVICQDCDFKARMEA
jgi:transposase-like protein